MPWKPVGIARVVRVALCLGLTLSAAGAARAQGPNTLWYAQPATQWVEALPVGNGRMGAMVFGGVDRERIQFNEGTLWKGQPNDYSHPGAVEHLAEIRSLLFAGKQKQAETLAMETFMSVPLRQVPYQPFGDLHLEFPYSEACDAYTRSLDLDTATAITTFNVAGVTYRREVFASYPDRVVAVRLTASKPGSITFVARLTSPHAQSESLALDANTLVLRGQPAAAEFDGAPDPPMPSVLRFEARLQALAEGGTVHTTADTLAVDNADAVTLLLGAATSYLNFEDTSGDPAQRCAEVLAVAAAKSPADLYQAHVADHQALFRRVQFELDGPAVSLPTDARVRQRAEQPDPGLDALLFQYGRYLLIACSRPGCQPANLQGIWNEDLAPPWDSKYTVNINTEMNYWPAESANLPECAQPLFDALDDLAVSGARVAKAHYGARGWVCHHNFDLWRGAAPINHSDHGLWPMGGAWLCQSLWEHYAYSGDKDFLAQRAYPLIKGAALFFTDYLVEDPRRDDGWLISGPSNSPEQGGLVMGPTMDHQIIRALFANATAAAKILGVDEDLQATWTRLAARIAPNQIGQYGQLQEWLEDKDNPRNDHRHVSHLWGVYPGHEINAQTPDPLNAARQSLLFRGDGGTGWSMAWKVNLWARLGDGDHAYRMLGNMLHLVEGNAKHFQGGGIYPNLFDAHPPFQIDGNFGACAGMVEMLLQSQNGVIQLLPALPGTWPGGRVTGLRARGGFDVDLAWSEHRLKSATLRAPRGGTTTLCYGAETQPVQLAPGDVFQFTPEAVSSAAAP